MAQNTFVPMLTFGQCLKLLDTLLKKNIIQKVPADKNDRPGDDYIIVYRKPKNAPEGLYKCNILDVASELSLDYAQQIELRDAIKDKNISSDEIDTPVTMWNDEDRFTVYGIDFKENAYHKYSSYNDDTIAKAAAESICSYLSKTDPSQQIIKLIMICNTENEPIWSKNITT